MLRSLPLPRTDAGKDDLGSQLHAIREQVVVERRMLADSLSRWAQFLASYGDNEQALRHIATIAWQLDLVRDAPLEVERNRGLERKLHDTVETVNRSFAVLVDELSQRLVISQKEQWDSRTIKFMLPLAQDDEAASRGVAPIRQPWIPRATPSCAQSRFAVFRSFGRRRVVLPP